MPGETDGDPLIIPPREIKTAFFKSLKREKENWEVVFEKGTKFNIPEPEINDIHKAILAKLWLTNDGDELRGGAVHPARGRAPRNDTRSSQSTTCQGRRVDLRAIHW